MVFKLERFEGISEQKTDFCVVCADNRIFIYEGYQDLGDKVDIYYRCSICNTIVPEILRRINDR